ncbi:hypothetical protein NEF87_003144 [Candidatus Lokiarchaeum ossiferum]|uniref:HTH marR-type domain-containing protein n=1 Tax=Candidatus Lokiarchaeum ossiferum TaxID=2951803 RepID=A0ABY6HWM4_9ARCH|nr:hypothetical protein NEF87_003144 [Candidatus Lokiarchaeum sp. B-35]
MNQDEDEILSSFFTLLHKVRDVLLVNRPELLEFVKHDNYKLIRDPFGRYFQIVLYIGTKKRTTMKTFANHFKLKAGTATGIIDQLVDKGLLKRETNPKDRRKVEIVLTEHGNNLYAKAIDIQKDEIRSVIDALNPTDIINLKGILKKINKALIIKERTTKK